MSDGANSSDGWNEEDAHSRVEAVAAVASLARKDYNYPDTTFSYSSLSSEDDVDHVSRDSKGGIEGRNHCCHVWCYRSIKREILLPTDIAELCVKP